MEDKLIVLAQVSSDIADIDPITIKECLIKEVKDALSSALKFGIHPIGEPEFKSSFSFDSECQGITLYRLVQRTRGNRFGYFLERIFNARHFPWHYLLRNLPLKHTSYNPVSHP